jgi:hypothetical protein
VCVEKEVFCEVRIQSRAYPLPLLTLDLHQVASIPSDQPQHLGVQNNDTSQRIQTERF